VTKPTDPAFPVYEGVAIDAQSYAKSQVGLTKLELFAAMAMQGICGDPSRSGTLEDYADDAVNAAKALIAALEKEQVRT